MTIVHLKLVIKEDELLLKIYKSFILNYNMRNRHWYPLGDPEKIQDGLPYNWRELEEKAGDMPDRFAQVDENLFRSAIPYPKHIATLQERYGIKNIVSLIDGDWLKEYYSLPSGEIQIHQFPVYQRRELTPQRVKDIVGIIKYLKGPTLVHCLKGVTRTGMVVAGYQIGVMKRSKWTVVPALIFNRTAPNLNISALKEIVRYY